jgi:hypothetical protein
VQQQALDLHLALTDPSVMIKLDLDSNGIDSFCGTMFFDLLSTFDFGIVAASSLPKQSHYC